MFSFPLNYSMNCGKANFQPSMIRATKKRSFDIASILKPTTINNSYADDTEDGSSDDGQLQPTTLSSSFECEQTNPLPIRRPISPKKNKSKRLRTIFTSEQLDRLEAEFEKQQYMVGHERLRLAHELDLSEIQVKIWFQNRRIKWRRQTLENHPH